MAAGRGGEKWPAGGGRCSGLEPLLPFGGLAGDLPEEGLVQPARGTAAVRMARAAATSVAVRSRGSLQGWMGHRKFLVSLSGGR